MGKDGHWEDVPYETPEGTKFRQAWIKHAPAEKPKKEKNRGSEESGIGGASKLVQEIQKLQKERGRTGNESNFIRDRELERGS